MQLRKAYEEALRYARTPEVDKDEEAPDENYTDEFFGENISAPVAAWMKKVDDVYCSLKKRMDMAEWKALLGDEICLDLEYADSDYALAYFYRAKCYYFMQEYRAALNAVHKAVELEKAQEAHQKMLQYENMESGDIPPVVANKNEEKNVFAKLKKGIKKLLG